MSLSTFGEMKTIVAMSATECLTLIAALTAHAARAIPIVTMTATIAACNGKSPMEPSTPPPPPAATVTSIAITGALDLTEGATAQLTATATMSDGSSQNVTTQATWSSSDPAVATVSSTGLVTTLTTGTADISAVYSSQTGRRTIRIEAARFTLTLSADSVRAMATCDDVTQGLTNGEFATRVIAVTPNGGQVTLNQTTSYPGNPANLRVYNLGDEESKTLNVVRTFTLDGAAGQFLRVQFNATEWDEQIVIIPPSVRWIHDGRLGDKAVSRTHTYADGTFTGLGPNTLTLGNSSCGIRLFYSLSVVKQ